MNNEMKWTPGPWSVCNMADVFGPLGGDSGDGVACDPDDGWQVAEVGFYGSFVDGQLTELGNSVREANLRLITAAPDLYEALSELIFASEYNSGYEPSISLLHRKIDEAKSALAKARGEL